MALGAEIRAPADRPDEVGRGIGEGRGSGAGVADRDDGGVSGSAGGAAGAGDAVDRELYRAAGFEEVAKHVEYVLATQPEAHRKLFRRRCGGTCRAAEER